MFLLAGSYQAVDDGVVLELFGRSRDGEATVARYYGFRPYFVLLEPTEEELARLRADAEIVATEARTVFYHGRDRRAFTVTLQHPWRVPEYRKAFAGEGTESRVLSSDIPFVHRFLYDKGLGLHVRFEAEEEPEPVRARYSVGRVVRVVTGGGKEIERSEPFRPSLRVLSFDIENAIRERTIFTICGVADGGSAPRRTFRLTSTDERTIVQDFLRLVAEDDPDVITGYNIGGYDLPLLAERARALGLGPLVLGRERSEAEEFGDRLWKVTGRVVADAWWTARRELRPKQESLQYVARTLLGDSKLDVDRRNITEEWLRDPQRVMEYCEHDADLALRILLRLRALEKAADLATVARMPLEEGLNGRTSQFIDAILIPRADARGIGVPPNHPRSSESTIEGGYVHAIRPGLYRWVVVLDFKAMYPSIIVARNLCFTTLSPEGTIVAPGGARFLAPEVRRGIIPEILTELLADRERFRQASRTAPSPEVAEYYDGLQNAVKVLMNSFYGVLASSFYRFTNKEIGASITAFAREAITTIIRELEQEGLEVIYSDTDSVFVRSPTPSLEGSREFGEAVARRFTASGATFEFQSVFETFFSHGAKKRYVGRAVWPKEDRVVRGYEARRSDAFDYQSEALLEVFDLVLKGDTDSAVRRARELVAALRRHEVPVERLVIARAVRGEQEYNASTRDALPFLRVYRQLSQEGYDVVPGMRVAWIVTDSHQSPQAVEPWIEGRPFTKLPDWEYYAERLAQTLARVTEVFGWDATSLLRGSHQQRLGGDDPPTPPADAPPTALDSPVENLGTPARRKASTRSLTDWS